MKIKMAILAALIVGGFVAQAMAACPPGTAYNCYTTSNGKQSCGCR